MSLANDFHNAIKKGAKYVKEFMVNTDIKEFDLSKPEDLMEASELVEVYETEFAGTVMEERVINQIEDNNPVLLFLMDTMIKIDTYAGILEWPMFKRDFPEAETTYYFLSELVRKKMQDHDLCMVSCGELNDPHLHFMLEKKHLKNDPAVTCLLFDIEMLYQNPWNMLQIVFKNLNDEKSELLILTNNEEEDAVQVATSDQIDADDSCKIIGQEDIMKIIEGFAQNG